VSGELTDRCVLVAGATGSVGGWIVAGALERGATVVAVGRSTQKLVALAERFDADQQSRLHPLPCDLSTLDACASAREQLVAKGLAINAVVAALGRWWEGTALLELPWADWQTVLTENLTAHVVAAQTFAPLLDAAADPCYLTMAGVAAMKAVAGSGAVSVTGAAQQMLLRVLAAENADSAVRFHQLLLTTPVIPPDDEATRSEHPDWILGPDVARHVARILDHEFDRSMTELQEPAPYLPR
jgi:NAD(P)-dependent dehydrogenase (short-subunit alcohol dehydrogenase family)